MSKPTSSAEGKPGRTEGDYKPWPGVSQGGHGKKPLDIIALHARFNPRLVGFGIVGPDVEASDGVEGDRNTEGRK